MLSLAGTAISEIATITALPLFASLESPFGTQKSQPECDAPSPQTPRRQPRSSCAQGSLRANDSLPIPVRGSATTLSSFASGNSSGPPVLRYTYPAAGSRVIRNAKAVFTSRPIAYIPSANQSRFIAARITPTAPNTSRPRKIFMMARLEHRATRVRAIARREKK
jgi:hypothetical protein